MQSRLTKAQQRVLQAVADDEVKMHFDVYGGYWWTEHGKKMAAMGSKNPDWHAPLPLQALRTAKMVKLGEIERAYSGYHEMRYIATSAGRRALAREGK